MSPEILYVLMIAGMMLSVAAGGTGIVFWLTRRKSQPQADADLSRAPMWAAPRANPSQHHPAE